MYHKKLSAVMLTAWMTVVVVSMLLTQRFDIDIFFVLALIGIIVIAELGRFRYVRPAYQRFIGYLILAGIVVFASIAVTKVVEILAV